MNRLGIKNLPEKRAVSEIWQRCQLKIHTIAEHSAIGLHYAFQEHVTFLSISSFILPLRHLNRLFTSFSNYINPVILALDSLLTANLSRWEQAPWLIINPISSIGFRILCPSFSGSGSVPVMVPDNSTYSSGVDSLPVL
jgi:hypothetical protein